MAAPTGPQAPYNDYYVFFLITQAKNRPRLAHRIIRDMEVEYESSGIARKG